jgi:hypothetical protein
MRGRRALIIGDQRQLEPITVLPRHLEHHLGRGLGGEVLTKVSPRTSSVQTLADGQSKVGTYLTDDDDRLWIGIPLCVHRRCIEPMFSIANHIAYNDIMVYATPPEGSEPWLGPSAWLHVEGAATKAQWVHEQGVLCAALLRRLLAKSDELPDLFFITPFRQVKQELRALLSNTLEARSFSHLRGRLRARIGTVHTFQGKEAAVVFLVLGCDYSTGGAADWAGERPNLLNVAVTRAQQRLYVIGDMNVWHNRGYFSDLHKALPSKVVDPHTGQELKVGH